MKATPIEKRILNHLRNCRYLPGSFDKKFTAQIDLNNVSPLQRYWIYKLGYKYRKQIGISELELICQNYLKTNNEPLSRKEAGKILKGVTK